MSIITLEKMRKLTQDVQVLKANTAVSSNFTLREGKKNRTYFQSSGLHKIM